MNSFYAQSDTGFCKMLEIIAAGARGVLPKAEVEDWTEVLQLAREHNVVSLLACALLRSSDDYCPEKIKDYLLEVTRSTSSVNVLKRQRILHLLHELEVAGIGVKLLKGYSVSRYYAYPESRDSVDTDIWIAEDQEQATYDYFEGIGFQIFERSLTSHHGICQNKKYGKIEIHTNLYDEIVEDIWFSALGNEEFVVESFERESDATGEYTTLGPTDQLLFLTLHMIKHFIEGGLSIRMMLDIALHYAKRRDNIDFNRYWEALQKLHYAEVMNAVLWIMIEYGGFEEKQFKGIGPKEQKHIQLLINDLITGGYMGAKEQSERYECGMEYNRQLILKSKNQFEYGVYMLIWKIKSGLKYMFPTAKSMKKRNRSIERFPMLYPFLLVYHVISFPVKKIRSGALKRDIHYEKTGRNEVSKRRIDMFKKLGMI